MISDKMAEALNAQINAEMYSAYLYLSMSAYAENEGLTGTANWLFVQVQEEMAHAQKIYGYVNRVGARIVLDAIEKPPAEFEGLVEIFEQVLAHEKKVTGLINALVDLASEERDHATGSFLNWFVDEQVEEEENANTLLAQLKLAGGQGPAVFMIDRELGLRTYTPPADLAT